MHGRRGMSVRASLVTASLALSAAAWSIPTSPAAASDGCGETTCTVSTSATSSSTSKTTSTSTTTSSTTTEVWNTILTRPSPGSPSANSQPVVMTEAQRIAQLAAGIKRDIYGAVLPGGCGGPPPAAPCPTADPAAPTVQQVASTTTTTTNTTRRTTVSVEELAERARAKIRLAKPNIGSAPCTGDGCQGAVGVPVWLWTQALPTQSESASAGGRTVTVSDRVTKVTWDLGNGTTITCNGSGTAYEPSMGWATSPDCGVPKGYTQAGQYTVTATFHHEVTYTGVNRPAENVTSTASSNVTIGEVQAIGVQAGG